MDRCVQKNGQLISRLFTEMRKAKNITQDALADNLLTRHAVSKLERFGIVPNVLVFDALLQRLGASTQFFMTMLSNEEYDYLLWKETILKKIGDASIQPSDLDSDMAESTHIHKPLQEQFREFWMGYTLGHTAHMEHAIALTVTGYPGPLKKGQCLSTEEIMYMLLHLELYLRTCPTRWQAVKETLLSVLRYIETRCSEETQIHVYTKAACLFGEYAADASPEEKVCFYRHALELLRRQAVVTGMCDILRGLLREKICLKTSECKEFEKELWALTWLKKKFKTKEQPLIYMEINHQYCLLNEVLGAYRQERGLKICDIDGHACSEKTYRALETGKHDAKKGTWQSLREYMDIPFDRYNAEIISDNYQDLALAAEIKNLLHCQKDETALHKLTELEKRLGDKALISQNAQFLSSIKNIMMYETGELSLDEYQKRVEDTIRLTIPDWNINYGMHFYTEREMILVYYDAIIFRKNNDYNTAIRLLCTLWKQLEQSHVLLFHRRNEALLINTLLKDLLTDIEDYDGAMEKVKIGIELSFMTGSGIFLDVYAFEPGWIANTRQDTLTEGEHIECLEYFRSAYYLSKLFDRKQSQKIIRNYCKNEGFEL